MSWGSFGTHIDIIQAKILIRISKFTIALSVFMQLICKRSCQLENDIAFGFTFLDLISPLSLDYSPLCSVPASNQAFPNRCRKPIVLPELTTLFLSLGPTHRCGLVGFSSHISSYFTEDITSQDGGREYQPPQLRTRF